MRIFSFSRQNRITATLSVLTVLTIANRCEAQVSVSRLFPPTISTGKETRVNAEGKFGTWPPNIVCDRGEVTVVAGDKSGELLITTQPDCLPGVAWIRFYDDQSISQLMPLMLTSVSSQTESEPNNDARDSNAIQMPAVVTGKLAKRGDLDTFKCTIDPGKTLVASVTANRLLQSPMDAVLQLVDATGNVLVQSDDERGLDPLLVYENTDPLGNGEREFLIRIFSFPATPNSTVGFAGDPAYVYSLAMTTGAYVDHLVNSGDGLPQTFGWNLTSATKPQTRSSTDYSPPTASLAGSMGWVWIRDHERFPIALSADVNPIISLPASVWGQIAQEGQSVSYRLSVGKGKRYRIAVESESLGFPTDPIVRIEGLSDDGKKMVNDDAKRGDHESVIEFKAATDREVDVVVSDVVGGHGPRHLFRVTAQEMKPKYELSLAENVFQSVAGKATEIKIAVTRQNGFGGSIRVSAVGLPESVQSTPVVSSPKTATEKSVTLKLTCDQPVRPFEFEIAGVSVEGQNERSMDAVPIKATYPLRKRIPVTRLWAVFAKDES